MTPMCIAEFRFPEQPPSLETLIGDLRSELGANAQNRFDAIEVVGDRVRLLSMDLIALMYGAKVCQGRGGSAVAPYAAGGGGRIPIPSWAETPWTKHGWFRRLRIRFGRISLARVPMGE